MSQIDKSKWADFQKGFREATGADEAEADAEAKKKTEEDDEEGPISRAGRLLMEKVRASKILEK